MDTQRPIEEMTLTELRALIDAEVQNHAANRAEAEAVEVQLAEVSSSIARLEDAGVAVPDQLREVKLGLHRRLSELTEGLQRVEDVRRHVLALLELIPAPEPVRREPRQRSKRRKRKRSTSGHRGVRMRAAEDAFLRELQRSLPKARIARTARGWYSVSDGDRTVTLRHRSSHNTEPREKWWWTVMPVDFERADFIVLYGRDPAPQSAFWAVLGRDWLAARAKQLSRRSDGAWNVNVRLVRGRYELYRDAENLADDITPFIGDFATVGESIGQ